MSAPKRQLDFATVLVVGLALTVIFVLTMEFWLPHPFR